MNITVDHIPLSTPCNRRPNIKMTQPTSITIHSTGNEKSTAKNERGWLTNPSNNRSASWHYVVDDCDIIEVIPPNEVAYHSGTTQGNKTSISIEMCECGNRELVIRRTKELVHYLMEKHNIRIIKRHYDWSRKNCPRILNTDGKWTEWYSFLGDIFTPKVEKKVNEMPEEMLKPSGSTLQKSVEYFLYRMELEGKLQPKWRQAFLAGELSQSDAIAIVCHAVVEGFIHNNYSNKE